MAYKFEGTKTERPIEPAAEQPNEIAELRKDIAELKALIETGAGSASGSELATEDLEAWVDTIGEHLARELLGAIDPEISKQKKALQDLEIQTNALKKKYNGFFRMEGFKRVLFWISVICNIGLVGYLIYTLIDWSAIIS